MNNHNNNNGLMFLTGAIAGAFVAYDLNTAKGKEVTNKFVNDSKELGRSIASKAETLANDINVVANDAATLATSKINSAKDTLTDKSANLLEKADEKIGDFQKGIIKAKNAVENGNVV